MADQAHVDYLWRTLVLAGAILLLARFGRWVLDRAFAWLYPEFDPDPRAGRKEDGQ